MLRLKPFSILWALLVANLLLGCGIAHSDGLSLEKSFLVFSARMVGLPLTSKSLAEIQNFSLSVNDCFDETLNGPLNIQVSSEKKVIELPGTSGGCHFVVSEMRILYDKTSITCHNPAREDALSVITGEKRIFECGQNNRVEVIIERGMPEQRQDVLDVIVAIKPLFTPVPVYSSARHTDSDPQNNGGFLYLSNALHISSSNDNKYNFFKLEFACPEQMQANICDGTDVLRQRMMILTDDESKFNWDSLSDIAKQDQRHILIKRESINENAIRLTIPVEGSTKKTLSILFMSGERLRLIELQLPEKVKK